MGAVTPSRHLWSKVAAGSKKSQPLRTFSRQVGGYSQPPLCTKVADVSHGCHFGPKSGELGVTATTILYRP